MCILFHCIAKEESFTLLQFLNKHELTCGRLAQGFTTSTNTDQEHFISKKQFLSFNDQQA
ncbi:hypothetical protein DV702_09555 [Sporosarcina sp. PTS2304]|nr:hypothetical protein DV702_09555 [Sporosarcina sp. PTS2304]